MSTQVLSAAVDFHGLCLQDADDAWLPAAFPQDFTAGSFVHALPGRIDITSAAHTHTVSFTAQVWEADPPSAEGDWEATATAQVECRSGVLRLWAVTAGPSPDEITLPRENTVWNVRLYGGGREAVARAAVTSVPTGIEHYLAQFWPA
ncbi:hypothetical protein [Streptomyces cavernicola]|uniref:Uncharacterized protein n=1 Tax=Streptomyces cavernicola TaxID=3043613 RepID=A0ABT6SN47_9ACTN|nr:hypothetical protein [Streptomyces sp. B-S-A6]MDI3409269.1 hypothetical protein [Streptomyces sp. B-S-A6]